MNNIEIHDAATQLAAGRTTYSLARELLGVRAELAAARHVAKARLAGLVKAGEHLVIQLQGAVEREISAAVRDELIRIGARGLIFSNMDVSMIGVEAMEAAGWVRVERLQAAEQQAADYGQTLEQMEAEEGQEITALRESLDEARAVLVNAMAIDPAELETPIRKEHRDYHAAQQMERKDLEQRYALARMTARLSMAKAADLEQQLAQLQDAARRQSGLLERRERDLDIAQQQTDRAIAQGQELAAQLDEAQGLVIQLTASAFNLRNRCKALEAGLPAPREVRRTGDQSLELTFHSCRLAGEFERSITAQGETPA